MVSNRSIVLLGLVAAASLTCAAPDDRPKPPAFTWHRHDLALIGSSDVIHVDDRFFTTAFEPGPGQDQRVILSSGDGIDWSVWAEPDFDGDFLTDLTWVDGQFIAMTVVDPDRLTTRAFISPDATTWKPWFDPGNESTFPQAFAKVDGRWVATVRGDGPVMSSEDGEQWVTAHERPFGVNGRPLSGPDGVVIPAPGVDVQGRGESQVMLSSPDGLTWSETTLDDGWIAEVHSTAANAATYIALGHARKKTFEFEAAAWWSTDGLDWQRASMTGVPDGLSRIGAVAAIDGGFVALWQGDTAESAHLLWSSDGRSWFVLEGGPVGRIAEPHAIVIGDRLRFYLQPEDAEEWVMWEGVPRD
jgi:hypothetical protein